MSSGSVRRVSRQDIQLVQNLIERCLQLYMNQKEVVETLLDQAKIEPGFTELVWQKLEEENREFFKAYYLRLTVKSQIIEFNRLLEQQVRLMHQMHQSGVTSFTASNGSHIQPRPLKQENLQHPLSSNLPNAFTNGHSTLHSSMQTAHEMSAHASRIDTSPNMLSTQGANMGLIQGMNGGLIKTEAGYSSSSPYIFSTDGNVLEPRSTIGDSSVVPFTNVEPNAQSLNEPLLDPGTSSFGFLGQIPRNFSLSDLTADFSHSSDILESYSRSPFLGTEADNFLDTREREHQGDSRCLDAVSEGLSYEDFGSE